MKTIRNFLISDDATTAVEYAVMLALIMLTCIVGVKALSNSSTGMWTGNKSKLDAVGF